MLQITSTEVLILYAPRNRTPHREAVSPRLVDALKQAASHWARRVSVVEYGQRQKSFDKLIGRDSLVLNLVYGFRDNSITLSQADVAEGLENCGAKLVGSPSIAQRIAQDKLVCAERLRVHGIRSPQVLNTCGSLPTWLIRKPRCGACHRGVTLSFSSEVNNSFFTEPESIVQEFIDGREYTVAVIEKAGYARALPPMEILFRSGSVPAALGAGRPCFDLSLDRLDRFDLMPLSEQIFAILGLRDYARIDFRINNGSPVVLDVNSLPNLDPERSFLPMLACKTGWSYEKLVCAILTNAKQRHFPNG